MNLDEILKNAVDGSKLILLDFDRELTEQFLPKLDHVTFTIHPEKYEELEKELAEKSTLIFESKESPTIKLHALNNNLEVANGQVLNKIAFKLKVTKKTKLEYVNFVVGNLATLHTYFGKKKYASTNMDSYTDGNKQFFIEVSDIKVGFSKRGFAESEELETLKTRLTNELEARLRIMADYQNYKKRQAETAKESSQMANSNLLDSIMEVIDDCNRAKQNNDESVDMLLEKLKLIIKNQGLQEIEVKKGDKFDAEKMQAITSIPGDEEESNTVEHVEQIGYKYSNSNKIFRPAKVVVIK